MKIPISPEIVRACEEFAEKRAKSSEDLYRLRGEASYQKMKADIYTGALAEFAVYEYLKSKNIKVSPPDLNIYEVRQKSFGADLKGETKNFHVKSQTVEAATKYGASWLFQNSDKILTLPSENEYLVFCLVEGSVVDIQAIISNIELVEANLTKKPKIPKYATTKSAIYLQDVLGSNLNKWNLPEAL
jgi:hypothetical protein